MYSAQQRRTLNSIEIRAAQIKSAPRTAQLAALLFQLRRAIWAKSLRLPHASPRVGTNSPIDPELSWSGRSTVPSLAADRRQRIRLPAHAHSRNIRRAHPPYKWETGFFPRHLHPGSEPHIVPEWKLRQVKKVFPSTATFALESFCIWRTGIHGRGPALGLPPGGSKCIAPTRVP
jgi:hypothetical protein